MVGRYRSPHLKSTLANQITLATDKNFVTASVQSTVLSLPARAYRYVAAVHELLILPGFEKNLVRDALTTIHRTINRVNVDR
jgi:hypothetical protein